jgi:4-diphosphocytidyl-2-C-methyl-D-erythritol kinase
MILFPNAKINLGLSIISKRQDGYHELETVMYPIPIYDILEITKSDVFSFTQTGLTVYGNDEDNLCVKTFRLMEKRFNIEPLIMHLRKQIPMGAGLGGGSADVAFLIRGINELFLLNLSIKTQQELASELGSDCAFFIENKAQLAKGRGEILKPIDLDLSNYWIKIIHPGIHISTKAAFENVYISGLTGLESIISKPISKWKNKLSNDFETHIFRAHPEIERIKNDLCTEGAVYASMSGSGSTVYGIFNEKPVKTFENYATEVIEKLF